VSVFIFYLIYCTYISYSFQPEWDTFHCVARYNRICKEMESPAKRYRELQVSRVSVGHQKTEATHTVSLASRPHLGRCCKKLERKKAHHHIQYVLLYSMHIYLLLTNVMLATPMRKTKTTKSTRPKGYWTAANRRKFFIEFAQQKGFDPFVTENWNSVTGMQIRNAQVQHYHD
jgi:hypothetical protein